MAIKNPHIIHFIRREKYLCNGAVSPTKEKSTHRKNKVTCQNCLLILLTGVEEG